MRASVALLIAIAGPVAGLSGFVAGLSEAGYSLLSQPATFKIVNPSTPASRGHMPARIHVLEDYETDIEKRWWLRGELETKNVPAGSKRACRGAPSKDFDDKQGDPEALYTAVVFNPVPGPPMGKQTRLSFRYWLKGSSALRVQIYSLSKEYHRCLTLTNLPQGTWESIAVDLTKARRPDGSGGALAEDERIDDIQLYTEPAAELIIDDLVLYDATLVDDSEAFPKRAIFTAWFDTGRQGQEWPGDFELVPRVPNKGNGTPQKAARSVPHAQAGVSWIRLNLRGERALGEVTHLKFRYHLSAADAVRILLTNRKTGATFALDARNLKIGEWSVLTLDLTNEARRIDGKAERIQAGDRVDEIQFLAPKDSELRIDDLLLYEPGPK